MSRTKEHYTQVHSKVENSEDLWLSETKYNDSAEFGQGDARKHRAPHVDQGITRSFQSWIFFWRGEGMNNVSAEFHGDSHSHDKIHEWNSIERNVPMVH